MAYLIRKSFTFEAAHQLEWAATKECCNCIHGHSYTVELVLKRDQPDNQMPRNHMVLDFGELKSFREQIMKMWDHGLILHEDKRPFFERLVALGILDGDKLFFMEENPTAEAMARRIFDMLELFLRGKGTKNVTVDSVRVHETSTGWAEYRED